MITEQKFLTESELKKLLNSLEEAKERDRLMIMLTMLTGARSQEVLNVTPSDLGEQSVTILGLKGSSDRTIPILDHTYWIQLQQYILNERIESRSPIFQMTTRHFRRLFKKYIKSEKTLKALRHTMGIRFYQKCRDIKAVQQLLGHKQILNTLIYVDYVESQEVMRDKLKGMF